MKKIPSNQILSPRSVRARARPFAEELIFQINDRLIKGQRTFKFTVCPGLIPIIRNIIHDAGWRATAMDTTTIKVTGPGEK